MKVTEEMIAPHVVNVTTSDEHNDAWIIDPAAFFRVVDDDGHDIVEYDDDKGRAVWEIVDRINRTIDAANDEEYCGGYCDGWQCYKHGPDVARIQMQ